MQYTVCPTFPPSNVPFLTLVTESERLQMPKQTTTSSLGLWLDTKIGQQWLCISSGILFFGTAEEQIVATLVPNVLI